jgi:molybdenum cofactor biosynthesis protein B
MAALPHWNLSSIIVNCAVITVSDTRTPATDRSGQLIKQLLSDKGHAIAAYRIVKDEPAEIQALMQELCSRGDLDAVILNGGTGIAPRDTTYDAIEGLLEKQLPGFGELFRAASFQEIGSPAIASRACAGVYRSKLIFSIPGSTGAVKLALELLILPELVHLVSVLSDRQLSR